MTARERFMGARVARLATVGSQGPHIVPVVFAVAGDVIYHAVDHKPKRTAALKRLANIEADPRVSLLADGYDEDWSLLWWARADGVARVLAPGHAEGLALLAARYPQYRAQPPEGPVVAVDVRRWREWAGGAAGA